MSGPVTIDWGDGTPKQDGPAQGQVKHQYAVGEAGTEQTITVCSKDDPSACTTATFTPAKDGGQPPAKLTVTAEEDTTDPSRMSAVATVDNAGEGPVMVDWGDGSKAVQAPGKGQVSYAYPRAGKFTVTVTDTDTATRTGTAVVTVPFGPVAEPKATAEPDAADDTGRTAKVSWTGFPQGKVNVDFGDGSAPVQGQGPEGTASHAYGAEVSGEQTITITSAGDKSVTASATFTPKKAEPPAEPKVTAEPDAADETGRTAKASWSGFPEGNVTIDWGDGSKPEPGQGNEGSATHAYGDGVKGEQTITVTAADDDSVTASATFTPKAGEEPAEPAVKATADSADDTGRTVKAAWSGFPEGKVSIDWGDGSEPGQGNGPEGTASHAYGDGVKGEQTITVTAADDDSVTASATFTPKAGEEPGKLTLTVKPDPSDTTNRTTVMATVDNGGRPVSIDFGQGQAQDNPGDGETVTKYAYTKDGTYTVTAVDQQDTARKDAVEVTVPFPKKAEASLKAVADPGDETGRTVTVTYADFPEGKVTVDFGDGSKPQQVDGPEGEISHAYGDDISGEQKITAVSVADDSVKASATFTPKEPTQVHTRRRYRP